MINKYLKVVLPVGIFLLLAVISVAAQLKQPKTVREYFMLLPQKYFVIEDLSRDKNKYIERFLEIEDTKNGYMKAGGDGSQEHFEMALFKRPNGTHVVGLYVSGEWGEKYYFLEYKNRRWLEVSKSIVPNYRKSNIYQLPRYGTTIEVYERKNFDAENNLGETGKKLYNLIWRNGRFTIKK